MNEMYVCLYVGTAEMDVLYICPYKYLLCLLTGLYLHPGLQKSTVC